MQFTQNVVLEWSENLFFRLFVNDAKQLSSIHKRITKWYDTLVHPSPISEPRSTQVMPSKLLTTPSPIACTVHGINVVAPICVDIVVEFSVPNDIGSVTVSSASPTAFGLPSAVFAAVSAAAANLPLLPIFFTLLLATLTLLLLLLLLLLPLPLGFCRSGTISLWMIFCWIFGIPIGVVTLDLVAMVSVAFVLLLPLPLPMLRPILPDDWSADDCCIGDTKNIRCELIAFSSVGIDVMPAMTWKQRWRGVIFWFYLVRYCFSQLHGVSG